MDEGVVVSFQASDESLHMAVHQHEVGLEHQAPKIGLLFKDLVKEFWVLAIDVYLDWITSLAV